MYHNCLKLINVIIKIYKQTIITNNYGSIRSIKKTQDNKTRKQGRIHIKITFYFLWKITIPNRYSLIILLLQTQSGQGGCCVLVSGEVLRWDLWRRIAFQGSVVEGGREPLYTRCFVASIREQPHLIQVVVGGVGRGGATQSPNTYQVHIYLYVQITSDTIPDQ